MFAFITFAIAGCSQSGDSPQATATADVVFTNGKVYTINEAQEWAEAVAVRGNEIVYVGDSSGAAAYVGEGTESIDLAGRMMLPGFVDSHMHTMAGGMIAKGDNLQTDSIEELLQMIAEFAASTDDDVPDIIPTHNLAMQQ